MRRLGVRRRGRRGRAAPDRGRRDGQRRDRGRAGRRAPRLPGARGGRDRSPSTSRRTRSSSPARTRSATRSRTGSRSRDADLLPDGPDAAALRPRPGQPAVRPARRDGRAAASRRRSSRPWPSTAGRTASTVIGRLLDRLPDALADDGVALLEIGADQGEAIVDARRRASARLACTVELDLAGLPRVARIGRG